VEIGESRRELETMKEVIIRNIARSIDESTWGKCLKFVVLGPKTRQAFAPRASTARKKNRQIGEVERE
jgi:hypothetical protein